MQFQPVQCVPSINKDWLHDYDQFCKSFVALFPILLNSLGDSLEEFVIQNNFAQNVKRLQYKHCYRRYVTPFHFFYNVYVLLLQFSLIINFFFLYPQTHPHPVSTWPPLQLPSKLPQLLMSILSLASLSTFLSNTNILSNLPVYLSVHFLVRLHFFENIYWTNSQAQVN